MDNLYMYIEKLAKEHGYKNITEFCREAEIPRATMSELKAGRTKQLSAKTSVTVANKLNIPISLLLDSEQYNPVVYCSDCGRQFNSDDPEEVKSHSAHHLNWSKAVAKFGFCWEYRYREDKKADARVRMADPSAPLEEKVEAQTTVFKALFSRSLEAFGYDLDHPDFDTYIAMLLNQGRNAHNISTDVYDEMLKQYGTKPGIAKGTYYTAKNENTPAAPEYDEGTRKLIEAILALPAEKKRALADLIGIDYE